MTDRLPISLRDAIWDVYAEGLACGLAQEGLAEVLLGAAYALVTHKHGSAVAAEWLADKALHAEAEAMNATGTTH